MSSSSTKSSMDVDDIPQIDPNVDYNLIQPIHQKRTIAFVNHFLLSTVSFLNNFADSCESRLMQFDLKLQKIEASLLILESQLSSIPDQGIEASKSVEITVDLPEVCSTSDKQTENHNQNNSEVVTLEENDSLESINGPKACEDPRYKKFFKMLQFGVPPDAVKHKMSLEGIMTNILDTPNATIPG